MAQAAEGSSRSQEEGRQSWPQASFRRDEEEGSEDPGLEVGLLRPARGLEVVGEGKGSEE